MIPQANHFNKDQDGTIYFFNETTGESRWDKPTSVDSPQEVSTLANERDDAIDYRGLQPLEINKLVNTSMTTQRCSNLLYE